MKGSVVNCIDVDDYDETRHAAVGLRGDAPANPSFTEEATQSHIETNDRTIGAATNVVNFVDFSDIETAPPSLSRQEPVSASAIAPRVTLNHSRRRMIVDVDEFIDVENKEDFSNSVDDAMPSTMPNPQRSASQNFAVKAVLGHDDFDNGGGDDLKKIDGKHTGICSDSVAGYTVDLNEDEIAAIVPPSLQRNRGSHNSTPGAFPVPGRGGVVAPIAPTRARVSRRRSHAELEDHGDGIHMISATLVGSGDPDSPMLVHAERLWWKRRLVLCLSVWMLLVIAVISVSVTLAVTFISAPSDKKPISNESLESEGEATNSTEVENVPTQATLTQFPSKSPIDKTASPVAFTASPSSVTPSPTIPITDPPGTTIQIHAVTWGVLTSCSDFNSNEVQSQEMILSCGGRIVLEKSNNVVCENVTPFNSAKLSCRLNSSKPYIDTNTNDVYQEATGLAMFSCRGSLQRDLQAAGELFNITVPSCSPSSSTIGTASSFVSMGRFCQDGSNVLFRDVFCDCGTSETCTVLTPSLPVCFVDSDDNDRRLDFFDDIKDSIGRFGDGVIAFCYESTSCSDQSVPSDTCTLNVPGVISEYIEGTLDVCGNPGNDDASIDNMWSMSQTILNPLKRIDVLVRDVLS